jgi:hypothetical protein
MRNDFMSFDWFEALAEREMEIPWSEVVLRILPYERRYALYNVEGRYVRGGDLKQLVKEISKLE